MWVFGLVWQEVLLRNSKLWTPCYLRKIHTGSLADVFPACEPSRFKNRVVHFKAAAPSASTVLSWFETHLLSNLASCLTKPHPSTGLFQKTNLSVCPASGKPQKVEGVRPVCTIARRLWCWTYKMEDTTGRRRGCTSQAPARVSFRSLRRSERGNDHPQRTLFGWGATGWRGAELEGGGKLKSVFFFRRRVRSGARRVRPGLPGGAGPAGEGPRSSSGNQTSAIRGCTATCNSLFTAAEWVVALTMLPWPGTDKFNFKSRASWNHDSHNALGTRSAVGLPLKKKMWEVGTKKCLSWRLCCLEPLLEQSLLLPCLLPARLWRQHIHPPPLAQTPPISTCNQEKSSKYLALP